MKSKPKDLIVHLINVCILLISIIPYFKTLFVEESGRFEILGQGIVGVVFIIGLYQKWRRIIEVIVGVYCFDILMLALIAISRYNQGISNIYPYIILILLHIIVVSALLLSTSLKTSTRSDSSANRNPLTL